MQSNFTNLSDIIDLDEPGNDNENQETNIDNFVPSPIKNLFNKNKQNLNNNNLNHFQKQQSFLPNINNNNLQSPSFNNSQIPLRQNYIPPYHPPKKSFNSTPSRLFNTHTPNKRQYIQSSQSSQSPNFDIDSLTSTNINEMTDKYEQLCEICNKIYHNNNQMNTMYIVIIISLFIIIMMLLKKVLK